MLVDYGIGCMTKQQYIDDGFQVFENPDGTISIFDQHQNPITAHETTSCCSVLGNGVIGTTDSLGYFFDIETQKCRWSNPIVSDELFSIILNPEGNSSTLFDVEENETCCIDISFDYLFKFDCESLNNVINPIHDSGSESLVGTVDTSSLQLELLTEQLNSQQTECIEIQNQINNLPFVPYVLLCKENNFCLTDAGLAAWRLEIGDQDYSQWLTNNGTNTSLYSCTDVENFVSHEPNPGDWYNSPCNYTIWDTEIYYETLSSLESKLEECDNKLESIQAEIDALPQEVIKCASLIDIFETFNVCFTLEVYNQTTGALETVYEETLFNIGSGNLYDYIDASSGNTGIIISGATSSVSGNKSLPENQQNSCDRLINTMLNELYADQYLIDNEPPASKSEEEALVTQLKGWYNSCWLHYERKICDPDIISLIENEKINLSISVKDSCSDFSILLDRIKMYKNCEKVDNFETFISEPPKFTLRKVADNKKSWLSNTSPDNRDFELKYRDTEYNTNHHRLVINTKEVDLNLSPARAVEQDVWCYINDNNCILEGCLGDDSFSAFTCPSGYTMTSDGNVCQELILTASTSAVTQYTVGTGNIVRTSETFNLSRGTIFVNNIDGKDLPIYWTGTPSESWVGPYYNSDYLVDSSGQFITHSGFGEKYNIDGSLKWSSPEAFSGIHSVFGTNNNTFIGTTLNPNILWGGSNSGNSGRLRKTAVWASPSTLAEQEWIGFASCFELEETKVYRIGFAADNMIRLKLNGEYIFNNAITPEFDELTNGQWSPSLSRDIQAWLVIAITIPSGKNIIEMEGWNSVSNSAVGFGLEVYDATEEQLKNMTTESELASVTLFNTNDEVGNTFQLGENSGFSCPTGYALDTCITSPYQCVKIDKIRRDEIQDNCCCEGFPIQAITYDNSTVELPLTGSTGTTLDCNEIQTLINNFNGTTIFESIKTRKCGNINSIGAPINTKICDINGLSYTNIFTATTECFTSNALSGACFNSVTWTTNLYEDNVLVGSDLFYTSTSMGDALPSNIELSGSVVSLFDSMGYDYAFNGTEFTIIENGFNEIRLDVNTSLSYDSNCTVTGNTTGDTFCSCPIGTTATTANDSCQGFLYTAATFNGSGSTIVAGTISSSYGEFGTFFYPDITDITDLPLTRTSNTYHMVTQSGGTVTATNISNNMFWDSNGSSSKGRLNNVGISASTTEWVGFSECIDIPTSGTYYIGVGADNFIRFSVDGTLVVSIEPPTTYDKNHKMWHVFPYFLTSGKHVIEMEGRNDLPGSTAFGAEIYYPTDFATLTGATTTGDTGLIFSTVSKVGDTFDLGDTMGYSCPSDYTYDSCSTSGTCVQIINEDISCIYSGSCTGGTTEEICDISFTGLTSGSTYPLSSFDGFWFVEENDGTIGVYMVDYISGLTQTYENVSDQVTIECCEIINDSFQTYSDMFEQGINSYVNVSWDPNKGRCVYRKCGDDGCINIDTMLTTELNTIDTVKEFEVILSSELIDVKNRQTIGSYPTLRMLYDRYNNHALDYCEVDSSRFDYFDMDNFGQTVGNYWIDLIEQVVPATTIWASTYTYKNTIFDAQKYNYKRNNLFTCEDPPNDFPWSPIGSYYGVDVILETLFNPNENDEVIISGSTTGSTTGSTNEEKALLKRGRPLIVTELDDGTRICSGVWAMQHTCGSEFIGTVKTIETNALSGDTSGVFGPGHGLPPSGP